MQTTSNLQELERKAYLSYQNDGLSDLALGMALLFGLGMLNQQFVPVPSFCAAAYPVWLAAKKLITEKRLGYVDFSPERKGYAFLFLLGCLILLLCAVGYLAVASNGETTDSIKKHGILLLGPLFGALISGVGLGLGLPRLHVCSGIVILVIPLTHLIDPPEPFGVIRPGPVIVLSGSMFLAKFIQRHPISRTENDA